MVTDRPALVTAAAAFAQPDELAVRHSWRWPAVPLALFAPLAAAAPIAHWALPDGPPHWAAIAGGLWVGLWLSLFAANSWRTMRCARSALEMVERGEDVRAIGLARAMYGYDATQAVQFVRGLRGRPRPDRT